jgi:hypothetical protein
VAKERTKKRIRYVARVTGWPYVKARRWYLQYAGVIGDLIGQDYERWETEAVRLLESHGEELLDDRDA